MEVVKKPKKNSILRKIGNFIVEEPEVIVGGLVGGVCGFLCFSVGFNCGVKAQAKFTKRQLSAWTEAGLLKPTLDGKDLNMDSFSDAMAWGKRANLVFHEGVIVKD